MMSNRMMFVIAVLAVPITWWTAQLYNQHQKLTAYKACIETTTDAESLQSCVAGVFQ